MFFGGVERDRNMKWVNSIYKTKIGLHSRTTFRMQLSNKIQ